MTHSERGSQIAEFAILLPALVPLLFGPLAVQRMYHEYQVLAQTAAEGARIAALSGTDEAQRRIQEMLASGGVSGASWRMEGPTGWGTSVRITVEKQHLLKVPLVGERQFRLSAIREARSERE